MDDFLHNLDWILPLRNGGFTLVFEFFTVLGYAPFFLLSLPILYWAWDKRATNRLAVVLLASAVVNYYVKDLFQDPRPERYFMEGHAPGSFGLPSGHTQMAIVFWFSLAIEIGKRWGWVFATFFVCGIAFSRLYLGVHDVEDVLAGAVLGVGGLFVFRWLLTLRGAIHNSIFVLLWGGLLFFWPHTPVLGKVLLLAGFFVGWVLGYWLEMKDGNFTKASFGKTAISAVVGLIALFGMLLVIQRIFVSLPLPEMVAQIGGGLLAGLFITYGIPHFLIRVGLLTATHSGVNGR